MDKHAIFPEKPNTLTALFQEKKAIIATIHLKPLPGAPRYDGSGMQPIIDAARRDAEAYKVGGVDGIIVENGWDIPFSKPAGIAMETVAAMTRITNLVVEEFGLPTGVNCLANGAVPALAIACASEGQFIRSNQWVNAYIANEGFVEGASSDALRYRSKIRANHVKIFADVHVKHGSHSIVADRTIGDQVRDAVFFDADVLIATGSRTGDATPMDEVCAIKDASPLPVIVGSGLDDENVKELFKAADGAIVGTFLKKDSLWWNPVSLDRVKCLMDQVQAFR